MWSLLKRFVERTRTPWLLRAPVTSIASNEPAYGLDGYFLPLVIFPFGPSVIVSGGVDSFFVRGTALATTLSPFESVTITPKLALPVPPMLAATRWLASDSRHRSRPPYGNAPLL